MGEDDPIIPLGAGTSPAFEDEIIDPFTYGRAPAISESVKYIDFIITITTTLTLSSDLHATRQTLRHSQQRQA